jgi:hypothetical protein
LTEVAIVRRILSVGQAPASEPEAEVVEFDNRALSPLESGEWRSGWGFRLLSLAPFGAMAFSVVASPTYFGAMFVARPEFLGAPLGTWLNLWFLTLGAIGSALVWRARSRPVVYAALIVCTLPAIFGILMAPAVVLYMQNLRV